MTSLPEFPLWESRLESLSQPFVARLRQAVDCRWAGSEEEAPQTGDLLRQGRTLKLEQGLAEVVFESGSAVILEGPCQFRLDGRNAGSLTRGKLAATVPKEAIGFLVDTPFATVTDLGTVFGVEVSQNGFSVPVFAGEVRVAMVDAKTGKKKAVRATADSVVIGGRGGELQTVSGGTQKSAIVRTMPLRPDGTKLRGRGAIRWGLPKAILDPADVSTNGVLVEAYNASLNPDDPRAVTVNGVEFLTTRKLLKRNGRWPQDMSAATNRAGGAYDTLLSSLDFGGGPGRVSLVLGDADGDTSVTGAGLLIAGRRYEIQVWYVDDRSGGNGVMRLGDGAGNTVDLSDQHVTGTFIAAGPTQTLTIDAQIGSNAQVTAYQIRALPEKSVDKETTP